MLIGLASEGHGDRARQGHQHCRQYAEHVLEQIDELPVEAQGSMYTDLQRGNRLELEWLNGLMVKLGEEAGVPTPCHRAVMMALNLHATGNGR